MAVLEDVFGALPSYRATGLEDWVRSRLEQGYTRAQLAAESGHPERAVTGYLRRVYGLREFEKLTDPEREAIRAAVAAGQSRDKVAQEFGISVKAVAGYARQLPGEVERQFQRVMETVGKWPATRAQIADAAFKGDGPAASAWLNKKVKRGWLRRVQKGLYDLGESRPRAAAQEEDLE